MSFFEVSNKNDFVMLIVGKRNRGKTTKCFQLLTSNNALFELFDHIVLICPTYEYNDLWAKLEFDMIRTEFHQEEITELDEFYQNMYKRQPEKHKLLILDDCLGSNKFGKRTNETPLNKLINLGRNYNVSVIILSQKFKGVPHPIRNNCDYYIFFKTTNMTEKKAIEEEVSYGTKDQWQKIWKDCFKKPYDWMMLRDKDEAIFCNGIRVNYEK